MSKNINLSAVMDSLAPRPTVAPISVVAPQQEKAAPQKRPPSRVGRKALQVFLDPSEHQVLKILSVTAGVPLEDIIRQALNQYLETRQLPTVDLDWRDRIKK